MTSPRELSIQLWSTRSAPSLEAQIEHVAACGYTNVEPYEAICGDPAALRALLDAHGLTARSGHFRLETFENAPARVVGIARDLGLSAVVAPWLDVELRPTDAGGWRAIGARLSEISRRMAGEGLVFAWHNHEFELARLPDGSCGLEHALGEEVSLELDLGWVAQAGEDPLAWLSRYAGRIVAVHVKDVAPPGENLDQMGFADVGEGIMDWPLYLRAAAEAGVDLMIVEHDQPADWRRFARISAEAMRRFAR
jgi:sugar phosphate isomerase/epimerase